MHSYPGVLFVCVCLFFFHALVDVAIVIPSLVGGKFYVRFLFVFFSFCSILYFSSNNT